MTAIWAPHPLDDGQPPSWASEWGEDEHGVFAAFSIGDQVQRLRWIRPGRFLMGSPESEMGRRENEGPQQMVVFEQGYWLAETPCTQALYEAITGENPSEFHSPDRPVEQVSWEDCQSFLDGLNRKVPGLEARLPSEKEWEYACRAGTSSATYAGELEILGENNAPILDAIAWYGGNSGVEFELSEGWDSSDWPEKQYPHEKAGTRPVGRKAPNSWGLTDMLGNVWEWCGDAYSPDKTPAATEQASEVGSERVLRGGSWFDDARSARAAARLAGAPGNRYDNLGFRLARGQGSLGGARQDAPGEARRGTARRTGGVVTSSRSVIDAENAGVPPAPDAGETPAVPAV